MFIFDLTAFAYGASKASAAAMLTWGKKTLESVVVAVGRGWLEQRGSDGPMAAASAETQLDLLIEPHITQHALYYQAVQEESRKKTKQKRKSKGFPLTQEEIIFI